MDPINNPPNTAQLVMPGMPPINALNTHASLANLMPGGEVIYSGNIAGGPRHGVHGFIRSVTNRTAVVNFGHDGTWYIPHFLLSGASVISGRAA